MMQKDQLEILLIEDNYNEAELAIRNLQKNNLANTIFHIDDGEDALDFIFSRGKFFDKLFSLPDLVLLDLHLPRIHGLQILKELKGNPETKEVPIIVLTGSHEEWDIAECKRLGANNYLVKPIHFETFFKAVTQLGLYWKITE